MKLRLRIVLLLIVAAVLPMLAVYVSLSLYSEKQRQSLVEMRLNNVYGAAVNLYERRSSTILHQARELAEDPVLIRYLMVKDNDGYIDQQGLIRFASEMRSLLNLDYLAILGADGEVLARGHDTGLFGDNLSVDPVFSEALNGQKVQSLVKIPSGKTKALISMGLAPIWYNNTRMIGVIAGGEYLDDEYCKDLRLLSGAEILLLDG
jgi:sensor histidine kinase regulating citrate/malate metabolism